MVPVYVIHFYLDKVEVVFPAVVQADKAVELRGAAVEGEAQVADAAFFPFLEQELHHAVLNIALAEGFHAAAANGVQQVIVEIVRFKLLKGVVVHLDGCLGRLVAKVGQLGGNVVFVARVAAEGNAGRLFALPLQVGGGGVEVIDTVLDGIIYHLIYGFLVYLVFSFGIAHHGPAHAAEADE